MLPILKANLWLIIFVSLLVALDVATGLGLLAAYWWVQQQVSVSRSLLLFSVFMQFEPRVTFLLKMPKFLRKRLLAQFLIFFHDFCCNVFVWFSSRCRYKNHDKILSIDKVRKMTLWKCVQGITPSVFIILISNKIENTLLFILQVPI